MNSIVFKGNIAGPVYYIERFIKYISSLGIDYYVCDVKEENTFNNSEFIQFASRTGTVMFTFNNFGIKLVSQSGENFWKKNNIPVFVQIVDHPRNFDDTFENPPCRLFVYSLDRNHVDYVKRFFPKVEGIYFSPNGGTEVNSSCEYNKRAIDVLYMGSGQEKIASFPKIKCFEDCGQDFYNKTFEYMIENTMLSTEDAIEKYFHENVMSATTDDLYELNENVAGYIENNVRRVTKMEGMKALSDMGVNVHVYGSFWEDEDYPFADNIKIHDRVSREELMEVIGNAKISLCFVPWYKRGCSEKNFDTMLNGALCISDRSEYLMENYVDGYNIVYFDLNNPIQMAADVVWLLDHPEEASQIAARGYKTARANDTWESRFSKIVAMMDDVIHTI